MLSPFPINPGHHGPFMLFPRSHQNFIDFHNRRIFHPLEADFPIRGGLMVTRVSPRHPSAPRTHYAWSAYWLAEGGHPQGNFRLSYQGVL